VSGWQRWLRRSCAAVWLGSFSVATVGFAQVRSIERLIMPGPVVSAHAELEDTCTSCHVPFSRELQSQLCLNCHDEIAVDLQRGTGFHGLSSGVAGTECAQCHTDHEGRDADILGLDPAVFDHDLTSFPLLGKHADVICEDCHAPDQTFHEAQTLCYSCHAEAEGKFIKANTHKPVANAQCNACHNGHGAEEKNLLKSAPPGLCSNCHGDLMKKAEGGSSHDPFEGGECLACHDAHGVSRTQGNASTNSNLINFDLSIVQPASGGLGPRIVFEDTGHFQGNCTLTCHGVTHVAFPYAQ